MAKRKKDFAVSFVINVHDSTATKKQLEELAETLVDEVQASFDAELASGITGDCLFNVDNLVEPPFAPPGQTMTLQQLEEAIGDHMDGLDESTDPRDPIAIRMSDGNPLTGAQWFAVHKVPVGKCGYPIPISNALLNFWVPRYVRSAAGRTVADFPKCSAAL